MSLACCAGTPEKILVLVDEGQMLFTGHPEFWGHLKALQQGERGEYTRKARVILACLYGKPSALAGQAPSSHPCCNWHPFFETPRFLSAKLNPVP